MVEQQWRDLLDPKVRGHLELQLKEVSSQKKAFINAPNANVAQLWCSIAILSDHLYQVTSRMKQLEGMLEAMVKPKTKTRKRRRKTKK
ncbi:hypothetical protein CL622_06300 [archaeon]|nr:hypothetical protein [archaeon]|tara:strand:+ start:296 stop:559 length:264 start_codon:yes stop_codon:yes gene_type:complete